MNVVERREFGSFVAGRRERARERGVPEAVARIVEYVRGRGDAALLDCLERFDGVRIDAERLEVSEPEFEEAYRMVDEATLDAIRFSVKSVAEYHAQTRIGFTRLYPSSIGVLGRVYRAVGSVGLYVPGGRKPYVSTVIMTAVPASVAGVGNIIACTPPRSDGSVNPNLVVACREAGVSRLFRVGGAQAIAAMAFGTESIPRVDKIAGPGNMYVTAAKRVVFGDVGIDSLAGPSEVAVIADDSADPSMVALDLLAQAEHGPGSLAVLITPSAGLLRAVGVLLETERPAVGDEASEIAGVPARDLVEAVEIANELAPEHLQVITRDPLGLLPLIRAAGAVLLGEYSPAALGDYVAGPSHVLPTGGTSRFSSGLTVEDFLVSSSVVYAAPERGGAAVRAGIRLAEAEGFTYHSRALGARAES